MTKRLRRARGASLERGHGGALARALTFAGGRRRGAQHLDQMIRARPGGAVEQSFGGAPGDPGRMACSHLMTFSVRSRFFVTPYCV